MKPLNEWTVKEVDDFIDNACKPLPGLIRGSVAGPLKKAAHEDRDHNGKVDVLEWLVKLQRLLDLGEIINKNVDFIALADFVDDLPFIRDKAAVKAALHAIAAEIEHAQKLAEAQKLVDDNRQA